MTSEIINVGAGMTYTLREVSQVVVQKIGTRTRLRIGTLSERVGEVRNLYCRIEKAKRLLGWSPTTSLDAGLDRTIAWYREHFRQL